MIKIENLTKYYGTFKALDRISFEVGRGEILGLLGPNGAVVRLGEKLQSMRKRAMWSRPAATSPSRFIPR